MKTLAKIRRSKPYGPRSEVHVTTASGAERRRYAVILKNASGPVANRLRLKNHNENGAVKMNVNDRSQNVRQGKRIARGSGWALAMIEGDNVNYRLFGRFRLALGQPF